MFALFNSQKTIRVLFFCILAIPFMPMILPKSVLNRFLSIGNLTDSSLQYRLYTWKGSARILKENFWGGIGYGNTAFREITHIVIDTGGCPPVPFQGVAAGHLKADDLVGVALAHHIVDDLLHDLAGFLFPFFRSKADIGSFRCILCQSRKYMIL